MKFLFLLFGIITLCFEPLCQELAPVSSTRILVKHDHYWLSFSPQHKQAEWVYYRLNVKMLNGSAKRSNRFVADPSLGSDSPQPEDYKNTGYDRGHLCPAGDMRGSEIAMQESFYMSNIAPQLPALNRRTWKMLEDMVRSFVQENGDLIIVTAGILKDNLTKIGPRQDISVPSLFYKIIYDCTEPSTKMIGFLVPNTSSQPNLTDCIVSVDSIETISGIDFFPNLPDSLERFLEKRISSLSEWQKNTTNRQKEKTGSGNIEERPALSNGSKETTKKSIDLNNRQCQAITKKGSRCIRKAGPTGRCWQHSK